MRTRSRNQFSFSGIKELVYGAPWVKTKNPPPASSRKSEPNIPTLDPKKRKLTVDINENVFEGLAAFDIKRKLLFGPSYMSGKEEELLMMTEKIVQLEMEVEEISTEAKLFATKFFLQGVGEVKLGHQGERSGGDQEKS
ncbi:hypothetical protein L1887_31915 [Cichorium endivia]|nr:hypothetical protein L1887_31915 [Cichorium endivia]